MSENSSSQYILIKKKEYDNEKRDYFVLKELNNIYKKSIDKFNETNKKSTREHNINNNKNDSDNNKNDSDKNDSDEYTFDLDSEKKETDDQKFIYDKNIMYSLESPPNNDIIDFDKKHIKESKTESSEKNQNNINESTSIKSLFITKKESEQKKQVKSHNEGDTHTLTDCLEINKNIMQKIKNNFSETSVSNSIKKSSTINKDTYHRYSCGDQDGIYYMKNVRYNSVEPPLRKNK